MIYTIGHYDSYEQYFGEYPKPQKAIGGSVWQTREEARKFCGKDYAVYGVDASWDMDTVPNPDGGEWHDLLRDSYLIKIGI